MALTDHDLSELLAALQAGEVTETIRTSLEWILRGRPTGRPQSMSKIGEPVATVEDEPPLAITA